MIKRHRPKLAQGKSDAETLELRRNPDLSQEMTAKYAAENEAKLRQAGLPVTPTSTYLMHFAGPGGGVKLMKADPNTPVESILSDDAIKANPFLRGKTVGWVVGWADKRMASAAASKPDVAPEPTPWGGQPIPHLAQTQAVEPAFGATSWPPHPASPNVLSPDAARALGDAPRVAPIPFVDGAARAKQARDNSLPAPGAAPWDLSNRFGTWDRIGGGFGPARSDGRSGAGQTGDGNGLRTGDERFAGTGVDPSNQWRGAGLSAEIAGGTSSFPPERFPLEALLASDRNRALDRWASASRRKGASPSAQSARTSLPGGMASTVQIDPSNPDRAPAAGLLGMIQDYMRNNAY
jgi:hypothetical protein